MKEDLEKKFPLSERDELAKGGIVAGGGMVALGGTTAAISAAAEKIISSNNIPLSEKRDLLTQLQNRANLNRVTSRDFLRKSKKIGGITAAVGAPILGISAYKHYKYKKKKAEDENKS